MMALFHDRSSPKATILAVDGCLTSFHPENDQVWELLLENSKSHPIHFYTTYGLRARAMRLLPHFYEENESWPVSRDFWVPLSLVHHTPDQIRLLCSPYEGLEVRFSCFLPAHDTLVGDFSVSNQTIGLVNLNLSIAAILTPMEAGMPTQPDRDGINQIITGQSGDLFPVLYMTGGPQAVNSPYPALTVPVQLAPGQSRRLTWALATRHSREASIAAARQVTASNWRNTAQSHAMQHNREVLKIRTGNPDWDAAFYLSQIQALNHLVTLSNAPVPFVVQSRLPDDAPRKLRSLENDPLSTLDLYHLSQVLLPTQANLLSQWLTRALEKEETDSQENGPLKAPPTLAHLGWQLFQYTHDLAACKAVYEQVSQSLERCFINKDGGKTGQIPVWDDPRQLQISTGLFNFDIWDDTGHGLDIHRVTSPALLAMLASEAAALSKMAQALKDLPGKRKYETLAKQLGHTLQATWDPLRQQFGYLDSATGWRPDRELYYPGRVQPSLKIQKTFLTPQRLQLHFYTADPNTRACRVRFNGVSPSGEALEETFNAHEMRWVMGHAHLTTGNLYQTLETLHIEGLHAEDRFLLETADFSQNDISCLLPLWAGAATKDQCNGLVNNLLAPTASDNHWGIPETWYGLHDLPADLPRQVNVLWNSLVIEGLLKSGFQSQAAALFTNLMQAISRGAHDFGGFYPTYDARNGSPTGSRNALSGLAPILLFLALAGIQIFSPERVAIWGQSPFPHPVEAHWQGLSVRRDGAQTQITFPDGALFESKTTKPMLLTPKSYPEASDG